MTPFISVIMPAYNSERYIAAAIGSLLSQPAVEVEIIVVSDGSTDGTERIVKTLAINEPRIRLLVEKHCGVAAARNVGLAAARGNLITFLDSDDLCAPGRLERQAQYLLANPVVVAVIGDVIWFDIAGSDGAPAPQARTLRLTGPQLGAVMFRREVFDTIGICNDTLAYAEDIDLLLRLWESRATLHCDREVAVFHRRHDANMTNNHQTMQQSLVRALHLSLVRRRRAGIVEPLPPMFTQRRFPEEFFGHD